MIDKNRLKIEREKGGRVERKEKWKRERGELWIRKERGENRSRRRWR